MCNPAKPGADLQAGLGNQAIDAFNQQASGLSAADAINRGNESAGLARGQGTQMIGQQKVGYAASGVDTASGSALDVMADTRMMSELDAQKLRNNAAREALGYQVKGFQYGLQGALDKTRTDNQVTADNIDNTTQMLAFGAKFLG